MNLVNELELSLKRFEQSEDELFEHPCLDYALKANIASLRTEELFYKADSCNNKIPEYFFNKYFRMIDICLRKFEQMIPSLDGQAWHVDLYREQMQGREDLIRALMQDKISKLVYSGG